MTRRTRGHNWGDGYRRFPSRTLFEELTNWYPVAVIGAGPAGLTCAGEVAALASMSPSTTSAPSPAAAAIGMDLVGVDLLPLPDGGHIVLELNGAVDFDERYSLPERDVYIDAAVALQLLPAEMSATSAPDSVKRSLVRIFND